ncbi:glutathione S-transferase family protein [Mesorhizobium ciceri]|uniref:glutathione S-transferase family protein n=2 Tax=Phyllobacteriaceae TaxID=69277 RepID=UPI00048293F9|nr:MULTISPECIES: glutathione S-transferase family protein [Mesorhizobium]AMY01030.1 glutathione S-transferase [Mesorhizobium ciceri biovar biserrulae]MBZ9720649.1 glutathione S-transferase family protein [Mesorhizobium sp. AD1-1]MBZ9890353.1 glutathione S-transferase family protein [Mesorhizobium sp. BR1-1-3]RUX75013.1 glutathione S-transferase family protein [Mesorhizobium sp. M7A.F.Ca.US.005.03.1.1]RUY16470.1 glutathione S-transferase family protein [Mesorhizobium sp. M7A.F.Ca.US.005.03.2.1]
MKHEICKRADKLILVSHHLCPYVQRAAISLTEKGVPFERVDIDLANKPDWFKAISPLGKVPLLRVQRNGEETVIFESAVILEFLEETQANPLHPADPYARARHRAWIEFGSATLNAIGRFYSTSTEAGFLDESSALSAMFDRLEAELADEPGGPWFASKHFSLVDAVYGPVFRYLDVFDRIGDFGILDRKPLVRAWRQALSERPSIRQAVAPDYPQRLHTFLRAKGSYLSSLIGQNDPATALRPVLSA